MSAKPSLRLAEKLLDIVAESGVNAEQAACALQAAAALVPDLGLLEKGQVVMSGRLATPSEKLAFERALTLMDVPKAVESSDAIARHMSAL